MNGSYQSIDPFASPVPTQNSRRNYQNESIDFYRESEKRKRRSSGETYSLSRAIRTALDPDFYQPSIDPFQQSSSSYSSSQSQSYFNYDEEDDSTILAAVSSTHSSQEMYEKSVKTSEKPRKTSNQQHSELSQEVLDDFLSPDEIKRMRALPRRPRPKQVRMDDFLFKARRIDKGAREFGLKTTQQPKRGSKKKRDSIENLEIDCEANPEIVQKSCQETVKDDLSLAFDSPDPKPTRNSKLTKFLSWKNPEKPPHTLVLPNQIRPRNSAQENAVTFNNPAAYHSNSHTFLNSTMNPKTPDRSVLMETVPLTTPSPSRNRGNMKQTKLDFSPKPNKPPSQTKRKQHFREQIFKGEPHEPVQVKRIKRHPSKSTNGRGLGSAEIARRLQISSSTVRNVVAAIKKRGDASEVKKSGRPRSVNTRNTRAIIKKRIIRNDGLSLNRMASQLGIARSTVQSIVKNDLKLKSYKLRRGQYLSDKSKAMRLEKCRKLLQHFQVRRVSDVIWTDEKIFTIEPLPNRQNQRQLLSKDDSMSPKRRLPITLFPKSVMFGPPKFDDDEPTSSSSSKFSTTPKRESLVTQEAQRKVFGRHVSDREAQIKKIVDLKFLDERENGYDRQMEKRKAELQDGQIIRNKEMRKNLMHGAACKCCRGYYDGLAMTEADKRDYIDKVSRHRYVHQVLPDTPEHYWDLTLGPGDEQELLAESRNWHKTDKKKTAGIQNWEKD
uniref:DNA endonuclease activator Ctp1 C-terminal domain-containing protein n=1 Tax=Caenorhabditis japonica TaxID=281687 RepID=A0A8R1I4N2_CAEJA